MKTLIAMALAAFAALLIAAAVNMAHDCTTGTRVGGMLIGGCK